MQITPPTPIPDPSSLNGEGHDAQPAVPRGTGVLRMAIGLGQGVALYFLYHSLTSKGWPATEPLLFKPLLLLALSIPLTAISSMVHLPRRKLVLWTLILVLLVTALGLYDAWRADIGSLLAAMLTAGLFIAQAMVLAGHADGRYIARYHSYFSLAWKLALQVAFALLFTLLLWLVLEIGAALFTLVRLNFLQNLLQESWFAIPASTLAFSSALHLTDVRPSIISGVRRLLLTVLSWLLPLALLIVAGFLASLVVTGVQPLWQTRRASSVLLGAAALLVVLINMVYQDGAAPAASNRFMAVCLRLSCLLPAPLVALGIYALSLRVAQYGWSVDRVTAALAMLIAAIYAAGYAWAALRRRQPLALIAPVNIAASLAILGVFVAVLSPLADPARIAVNSQLARLQAGQTPAAEFDFRFLRFEGMRFGVQALRGLRQGPTGEQARLALAQTDRWSDRANPPPRPDVVANVRVHPAGAVLPKEFVATRWEPGQYMLPSCLRNHGIGCEAYLLEQAGQEQILIFDEHDEPSLFAAGDGRWDMLGKFELDADCRNRLKTAVQEGKLQWLAPRQRDIDLAGTRLVMRAPWTKPASCPAR
ncbi:MAG: hypothetical protein GAK35_03464 [Herbaspirillum frisingense]|uniref:DUF4153 domain-containing protein n=1 Tax=Herbaspirillum frisingense TaxID=92645 RepID=A0A7V8FUH7_9BURK|nr:MAG: hypothetical protein GAK35_03464 [Herbaspirillum frisingense]